MSAMPTWALSGLGADDTIILPQIAYANSSVATLVSGNILELRDNGQSYDLALDPTGDYASDAFIVLNNYAPRAEVQISGVKIVVEPIANVSASDDEVYTLGGQQIVSRGVSGTRIEFGGSETVSSGGVANSILVGMAGAQYVNAGGVVSGAKVDTGGVQFVNDLGVADDTEVDGGRAYVQSGGFASGTIVSAGGLLCVSSGGKAQAVTVDADGKAYVAPGGSAVGVLVNSHGSAFIGGDVESLVIAGGTAEVGALSSLFGAAPGPIAFAGSGGVLSILGPSTVSAAITGFAPGDLIDLTSAAYSSSAVITHGSGDSYQLTENGQSYLFHLDLAADVSSAALIVKSDGNTGTTLSVAGQTITASQQMVVGSGQISVAADVANLGSLKVLAGGRADSALIEAAV